MLLCAFLFTSAAAVNAATLFGKVIEVNSGDVITILNLNRPVRVRLLGVDAPEMDQTFGDVAKKHLTDLVYNKSVLVEYAGISSDHSLNGRVLLEGADIGAQMIRDGAAWVDPSTHDRLSATDREVYEQSELAARLEGRGLWQQENPIAPWEFVKARTFQRTSVASSNESVPVTRPAPDRPTPELNSLTLMASRLAAAAPMSRNVNSAELTGILPPIDGGTWRLLRPARESFSALVPEEGEQKTIPIPGGDRILNGSLYRGRDGRSAFVVWWLTGPTYGEGDVDAIKASLASFFKGFSASLDALYPGQGSSFSCELQNEKDVSMRGFTGLEFDMPSCTIPTKARVFTRVTGSDRQMYVATVFYMEQDANVPRFLNSFKISGPTKSTSQKK
ncbi:MAG TPA: thermonuclease family protein [Pyrinomonadaceae bacterium]|nr:thermonuclease family protein [Pyrinomonadaceae bacterium]